MARTYVADLNSGEQIDEVFLVREKDLKTTRNGSLYMQMMLADRTGSIKGMMWDATEAAFNKLPLDDFVRIKGQTETYQNDLQMSVKRFEPVDESGLKLSDFLPRTEKNVKQMLARLREIMTSLEDEKLRALVEAFLDDEEFMDQFMKAPAAMRMHHAFLGGLLEHTLSLVELAERLVAGRPEIDRDVLLAGAFLHDIGKTRELSFRRSIQYSDEGQLLGHLIIGVQMIEEKARAVGEFPAEGLQLLEHLILSHHGQYEFGSPKLPSTAEAIALHYLDNLDAKLFAFQKAIEEDRNDQTNWTEYSRMFERRLFKGWGEA